MGLSLSDINMSIKMLVNFSNRSSQATVNNINDSNTGPWFS